MLQYSLYVIKYLQLLISNIAKGCTMSSSKKYTVLFLSSCLIFFFVSLILSRYISDIFHLRLFYGHYSSTVSSVAFVSYTIFTNHTVSTDFTSAAITYVLFPLCHTVCELQKDTFSCFNF